MLLGTVYHNRQPCQFLHLLRVIKTSHVACLCNKSTNRHQSNPFDSQPFVNIWDLFQQDKLIKGYFKKIRDRSYLILFMLSL